jgi:uncharacterized protein (DUF58 family)
VITGSPTFPLVSRRRLHGLAFGAMHGARRGTGSDVSGSRAYVPGDDPDRIDWASSARLSAALGTDEFIVREHFADEAPRAVAVLDRGAGMALPAAELPWLDKSAAAGLATEIIAASVTEARGLIGFLEFAAGRDTVGWAQPASGATGVLEEHELPRAEGAEPPAHVAGALDFLGLHRRAVPSASFVFVLSDFLAPPPIEAWEDALDRGWDVVPVVIQDPVWEQSFPEIDGLVVPLAPVAGRTRLVRLRRGESAAWRQAHEERRERLLSELDGLGIEPVLVSSSDLDEVFESFAAWSTERQSAWSRG